MTNELQEGVGLDRDKILKSTHDFLERYALGDKSLVHEEAKKHLHRGFIVRVMMIQHAAVTLDVELLKASGPISGHLAIELSVLVNSFYLNLAGSLDNLAWALAYQYGLEPDLDEENAKHRRFATLLNPKLLDRLRLKKERLADHLYKFENWNNNLRKFRDPGAHRIPIFIHPSIYTEQDVEERKRLDSEAARHFSEGSWEEGRKAMYKIGDLGTFHPVFTAEVPGIESYYVGPKITEDVQEWYRLSSLVFEEGFGLTRR